MPAFTTKALSPDTWPDFAALVERSNGVWGGCWCMGFHAEGVGKGKTVAQNRAEKETRVRRGDAHAALVYDGPTCVGWCQFGSPAELPRIKHKRTYLAGDPIEADWRITCFFTDKTRRGEGIAAAALAGALQEIARLDGGLVESFPEDVSGRTTSSSFLYNATLATFEAAGFKRVRQLGMHHWIVSKTVKKLRQR